MYYDRIPLKLIIIHTVDLRRAQCACHCIKHRPKNQSSTAHGWIPMWRKMNCEKTPSSTEQLVPANKALFKKLTRAQDERQCHRACVSVPPDSSIRLSAKVHASSGKDWFLRDL